MRKFFIIALILFLLVPVVRIHAEEDDDKKGFIIFSGTNSTNRNELAITNLTFAATNVNNITGSITYDKNTLAVINVEKASGVPSDWKVNFKYSTPGVITFDATASKSTVNGELSLLKVTFVVIGNKETTTTITSKNCTSTRKETVEIEKEVVTNQAEIDAAKSKNEATKAANPGLSEAELADLLVPVPEAKTETKVESQEVTVKITYTDYNQQVRVANGYNNNAFLKSISVENGTFSTEFTKTNNSYKVTLPKDQPLNITAVTEDPHANYEIKDEVNNQVMIVVHAEDGSTNTYVLSLVRQANGPTINTDPANPVVTPAVDQVLKVDPTTLLTSLGLGLLAIAGIVYGSMILYKGAHEE